MGKKSRDKGAAFEREIAAALRSYFPDARRRGNAQADGRRLESDVEGVPNWAIECKRYAKPPSWKQCEQWFDEIPRQQSRVLIVKADRRPALAYVKAARYGFVCMPFDAWLSAVISADMRSNLIEHAQTSALQPITCSHGENIADCQACYIASDFAFDASREG